MQVFSYLIPSYVILALLAGVIYLDRRNKLVWWSGHPRWRVGLVHGGLVAFLVAWGSVHLAKGVILVLNPVAWMLFLVLLTYTGLFFTVLARRGDAPID